MNAHELCNPELRRQQLHNGWLVLPLNELYVPNMGMVTGAEARFGVQYMSGKLPKTRFPMITFPWQNETGIKSLPKARRQCLQRITRPKDHIYEGEGSCHVTIERICNAKKHNLRVGIDDETYTAMLLDRRYYEYARRIYVYNEHAHNIDELIAQQQELLRYSAEQIIGLLGWFKKEE